MARTVKSSPAVDSRKNEAVAQAIVQQYPKDVSGMVGMHALGKLADMMPHDDFVAFVEAALHHATTGQVPEPQEEQGQEGEAAATSA